MLSIFEEPQNFDIFHHEDIFDSIEDLKSENHSVPHTKTHQNLKKKINLNKDSADRAAYIEKIKKKLRKN